MKFVILTALAVAAWAAPATTPAAGNVCNYRPVGDESNQKSVPIQDFRSSGLDFVRPNWCITHCADRKSIKVAARFDFANTTSTVAKYKVRHTITRESGHKVDAELLSGVPSKRDDDPFNFCMDDFVSNTVDQVINQNTDLTVMAEALNYYINKPGWAYIVYDMGPPPSIVETDNVHHDMNYCSKFNSKQLPDGSFALYQVFAGLIKADN